MDVLATNLKKCLICKSGDIVEKNRHGGKEGFVIYGRNGARPAVHIKSRCNFTNSNFDCGAGYFHGYMTYKMMILLKIQSLLQAVRLGLTLSIWWSLLAEYKLAAQLLKEQLRSVTDSTTQHFHMMS